VYIKINGFGIDYNVEGPRTGIPVVFIHGFPFNKEIWKPQIEAFKKDYYIISYDVRGHGTSDVGNAQYTIEYCVDDFIHLLNILKVESAVVVGHSMGGYIALRAIERNPERFRGLVLCNTRSECDTNEVKINRALQAKAVKFHGTKKFANKFLPTAIYEKTIQNNPELVRSMCQIIEKTSPNAIAGMLIALSARTDSTPSLTKINVPTLIMVGQFDELTPPSVSISMKEKIPNAELNILPNSAHLSNLENPEEFNQHLLEFLNKIK